MIDPYARSENGSDVFVWPDSTHCFRSEYYQMTHMSDDFYVIYFDTEEWWHFFGEKPE